MDLITILKTSKDFSLSSFQRQEIVKKRVDYCINNNLDEVFNELLTSEECSEEWKKLVKQDKNSLCIEWCTDKKAKQPYIKFMIWNRGINPTPVIEITETTA